MALICCILWLLRIFINIHTERRIYNVRLWSINTSNLMENSAQSLNAQMAHLLHLKMVDLFATEYQAVY
jgi:hypothetical protein